MTEHPEKAAGEAMRCPCGRAAYRDCCQPLHQGVSKPDSAEALMRSRYSAFALGQVDYLAETALEPIGDLASLRSFCQSTHFFRLEILDATERDVHFKASSIQSGQLVTHVERSQFVSHQERLKYLGGEATFTNEKIARNAACPCGSGVKFKACHAK
jgi:SEC-C motif domain protein